MVDMMQLFPIILYLLGIVLLIILIILGVKLIHTVNKANQILDDAYNKTKSLNGLFNAIDSVTDALSSLSDSIASNITGIINKIFHRKRKMEKEID